MGANAQLAVPAFVAGEVLTAAEMTQVNTGIPVFATTVTRDAAFGGTGEKTLAQGQYAYIEATSTLQSYNGSAWVTAGSGLNLISATTIGNSVATVTVSGAFSATYEDYLVLISGGVASADNILTMTLGATATGYYYRGIYGTYSSSTNTGDFAQNTTSWTVGAGSTNTLNALTQIQQPFTAKNATYTASAARTATNGLVLSYGGYLANTTSYTAFTVATSTGTMTGGTIYVYGYAKA